MNGPTKATLRLCCKESKAAVDATVDACTVEPDAFNELCNSDWSIKYLTFNFGHSAEEPLLPSALVTRFPRLEKLKINNLTWLEALPEEIGELQHLKELCIRNSEGITALPLSFAQLSALEKFDLVDCCNTKIQGLAPLKQLKQLKSINTFGTLGYKGLLAQWLAKGDFPCLVDLSVDLGYLEHFPQRIMTSFIDQLTRLAMKSSARAEIQLDKSITALASTLQELVLDADNGLVVLPDEFAKLTALRQLKISAGWDVIELLPELTRLENLDLRLVSRYNRECLQYYNFLGEFPSLKKLRFYNTNLSVFGLPDTFGALLIESLAFDHVGGLVSILNDFYGMQLTELRFSFCYHLEEIDAIVRSLSKLKILDIRSCQSLADIPENINELNTLETLVISNCNSIVKLPSSIGSLRSLKRLSLCLRNLEEIPETLGGLKASLQELQIAACHTLENLPASIGSLSCLKSIQISTCNQLARLPNSIWKLDALQRFDIDLCPSLKVVPPGEPSKAFKLLKIDGERAHLMK